MATAWGKGGSLRSCDALLQRVEKDDPKLTELVILPMKTFGPAEAERLSRAIASGANTALRSVSASGHSLPPESLRRIGLALSAQAERVALPADEKWDVCAGVSSLAVGCKDMGDEGTIALCEGLEGSGGGLLRCLDLGWKSIGKDGARAIGKTFASSKSLTRLDLSRNESIGSDGIARMASAAREEGSDEGAVAFPSLEELTLSECDVGPAGAEALAQIVLGPDDDDDDGGGNGGGRRAGPIRLSVGSNPIGANGCVHLSRLLRAGALSRLEMPACAVGDEGVAVLSAAATSPSSSPCVGLTALDLSENSATGEGAARFAESLAGGGWPDLTELKLAKNDLGAEGAKAVAGALAGRRKGSAALGSLDLSRTNCGAEGARAALGRDAGLTTLRLFDNRLGSEGFRSIAPLLRGGHPSIANLDLGGNNADEDAVVALLNEIAIEPEGGAGGDASPSALVVLEIGGNKFGDRAMEALKELQRVRPLLDVAHDKPVQDAEEEEEGKDEDHVC